MASTERLAELRRNLVEHFNLDELRTLCFDLGVNFDNLAGETLDAKARELLDLLDRQGRIPDLIAKCAELRPEVHWREIVADEDTQSPFKGLQYFDVGDAELFFGREDLTAQLVHRIDPAALKDAPRFLAVVGASGSGKSSLVRAGLVAALESGQQLADGAQPPAGSRGWRVHVITPTADPLQALAASLTRDAESVTATATLMDDLARDPRSLHLYALKLTSGAQNGARLLLVVDQFEELFTQCKDEAKRKDFVDNLITAASPDMHGPTLVVIALRADFYAQCGQYEALRGLLEKKQAFIGRMNKDELRHAIEEPAQRHGYTLEPGLTDALLRDVGDEPGALPLLSHALLETWKRRRGRTLTLQGYAVSGGLRGAIAKTADDTFAKLPPDQQAIARNIFLRLTELGEGVPDTRRRARLDELISQPGNAAVVNSVLQTLADARLITTGEGTAEVAHEALIREWPVLIRWLDDDREGLRVQRQLTEDAGRWQELGRDEGALYRGLALGRATQWAEAHGAELSALEREFVAASRAQAEAQRRRELEQAQQLAEAQRAQEQQRANARLRQRAWLVTGIAAIALALAGVATLLFQQANTNARQAQAASTQAVAQQATAVANADARATAETNAQRQRVEAEHQAHIALGRQVAAQALSLQDSEFDLSLLLAKEAYSSTQVFEARSALLDGLQSRPRLQEYIRGYTNSVTSVAFSPDGKTLASGSWDNTILLWDVSNPAQPSRIGQPLAGHTDSVSSVAFSPDGKTLASGSGDKTIRLWDVSNPAQPSRIGQPLDGHTDSVLSVAFSPDGKTSASGHYDKTIRLWDVSNPARPRRIGQPLEGHADVVRSVAFSPDGKTLASGSYDNAIRLWDVSNPAQPSRIGQPLAGHMALVASVAFSPDGKMLASGSDDNTIRLWDVDVESWMRRSCHIANRNLTQAEWKQYLPDEPYHKTCPDLPAGE